jgi:hypothetical protein
MINIDNIEQDRFQDIASIATARNERNPPFQLDMWKLLLPLFLPTTGRFVFGS